MTVLFLDTTILVGAADRRDERHADAKAVFETIARGKPGTALVSDYVIDETVTILAKRRGVGADAAAAFAKRVIASPRILLLNVDDEAFSDALRDFPRYGGALSFTDVATVTLMRRQRCDKLCSHDAGFDRVPGMVRKERL